MSLRTRGPGDEARPSTELDLLLCVSVLFYTACLAADTGLQATGNMTTCLQSFACITTGGGETLLTFGSDPPLNFRHSQFQNSRGTNRSLLNGEVTAGNLSRSVGEDCNSEHQGQDYCYTVSVTVALTPCTMCKTLECITRVTLSNGSDVETPFGSATVGRSELFVRFVVHKALYDIDLGMVMGLLLLSLSVCHSRVTLSVEISMGPC